MTSKPLGAPPSTLRGAIRTALLRAAGEQRFGERVEDLDRYADAVAAEVHRHQCNRDRTRKVPFEVEALRARLLHLADRAEDGRLLPAEAQQLREGIRALAKEARQ